MRKESEDEEEDDDSRNEYDLEDSFLVGDGEVVCIIFTYDHQTSTVYSRGSDKE